MYIAPRCISTALKTMSFITFNCLTTWLPIQTTHKTYSRILTVSLKWISMDESFVHSTTTLISFDSTFLATRAVLQSRVTITCYNRVIIADISL